MKQLAHNVHGIAVPRGDARQHLGETDVEQYLPQVCHRPCRSVLSHVVVQLTPKLVDIGTWQTPRDTRMQTAWLTPHAQRYVPDDGALSIVICTSILNFFVFGNSVAGL